MVTERVEFKTSKLSVVKKVRRDMRFVEERSAVQLVNKTY